MADKRDYYEVLGVTKQATPEEIKKAYRKITKENHPDLHPGDKACEERFKEANEAYEVLSDEEKRKKYDQFGHAAFDPNAGFNGAGLGDFSGFGDIFGGFGDIFSSIFGGGARSNPNAPRKGSNVRSSVNISFEEAAFGCEKEITYYRTEQCPDCGGTGCAPGTTAEVCPDCSGTGRVRTTKRTPFGMTQSMEACPKCRGAGKIIHQPCKTCRGVGSIRRQHKMTVKIPAGVDDGQSITRAGFGSMGANGGPAGDLVIPIIVRPHAIFEREGTNVYMEQEISFAQAALGAELELPTLDGKVKYSIPEGTQPGTTFRLRGKGIPYLRSPNLRGDQFVTVKVAVPRSMSSSQKELLRQYAASMGETDLGRGGIFGRK
jgi:molecular chaperone DnaJ